jgi:predicted nucleotidyltransferase
MRVSQSEINQIIEALSLFIAKQKAELYLYGSRTDDELKGGDIDLLLILDTPESARNLLSQKHRILAQIKELIGEQRIDLKIASKNEIKEDTFLQLIMPDSILLYQWQ